MFVIYLTSLALPLLQRLSFKRWWSSVHLRNICERDSIECFIHWFIVSYDSLEIPSFFVSTIFLLSPSRSISPIYPRVLQDKNLVLVRPSVHRYSSLLIRIEVVAQLAVVFKASQSTSFFILSSVHRSSFHRSSDRSIEVSLDPWRSLTRSTVDIQRAENNNSRITLLFFLLARVGLINSFRARFRTYSS